MPRPAQCDDDCDYDDTGRWQHHARCASRDPWAEDMAVTTAREDGYTWRPATVLHLPQRDRRAS
ncbi:hypothetical protein [Actinacidiphila reveromycinica]|nr:hypothetical protein [Streptomyces sp. SN-593]